MFSLLGTFHDFLSENNHIEKIYEAMESDDYSEVVMTALDILKKAQLLPLVQQKAKSVDDSNKYRNLGNEALKKGLFQNALILYNKALLFAPKNSKEMVLAYSDRSQLLQSQTAYIASLADIETCLTMDCKDILQKLTRRKQELEKLVLQEQSTNDLMSSKTKYIDTDIPINVEIPCASNQIKIDRKDNPKIVAATAVNAGCVLANERAFVSYTLPDNSYFSCHFCQKIALNLIPCDGCCHVLFCDEVCRKKCITEYHEYECQIMDILTTTLFSPSPNLMFKATLKIRSMSESWQKLINDYDNMNTVQTATVNEIFDYNNKFSILQTDVEKPFVHGIIYNASFACAVVIHYLQELTSFFPKKSDEKEQALRVFSKIMMFLSIQQTPVQIFQRSRILMTDEANAFTKTNFGLYSFTGKIKTSCKPNIMVIYNNHQLILIAIKTLTYEEELTISIVPVKAECKRHERNLNSYRVSGAICNCNSCDETIPSMSDKNDQLSKEQMRYYSDQNLIQNLNNLWIKQDFTRSFPIILRALDILSDVQYSPQYKKIMGHFKTLIFIYEITKSKNYLLKQKM